MNLRLLICLGITFFANFKTQAQDAHYWSSNYSAGGFFAPGAVVANNRDSGVLAYNPALLAYNTKNAAAISGNVYQWNSTKVKDALGSGLDLKHSSSGALPQMVSNILYLKLKKPFSVAYGFVSAPLTNFQATTRKDAVQNVLNDVISPGREYYVGEYSLANSINETKGIVSAGFKLNSKWALGISTEFQQRRQLYSFKGTSRALINDTTSINFLPPLAISDQYYQARYMHIGVRFKVGLAYDISKTQHLGLTIHSPLVGIGLFNSAEFLSDNILANLIYESLPINLLATTRQTKLKPKYKMPLSIALGYVKEFENGQLYLAAEHFLAVKDYSIISPRNEAFIRPPSLKELGDVNDIRFFDSRKAVTNFSIGVSHVFKPTLTGYLSFRTDFNYTNPSLYDIKQRENAQGILGNVSQWNNYHLQIGTNFRKRKFNLRGGLILTYGRQDNYYQDKDLDSAYDDNFLSGNSGYRTASHFLGGILISYIHNL